MAWERESENVSMPNNTVHVWLMNLDANRDLVAELTKLLSLDEKEKAAQYHFEKDSSRYALARATLRILLARYLKKSPAGFEFGYNEFGKPFLKNAALSPQLSFNVSHSAHLALFAFSRCSQLGVDIEMHRKEFATLELAERFFFGAEIESLKLCDQANLTTCFFDCWTRKEAYIKAKGLGLSLPLDSFAVSTEISDSTRLLLSKWYPQDPAQFSLQSFDTETSFSAAVAVNEPAAKLEIFKIKSIIDYWEGE